MLGSNHFYSPHRLRRVRRVWLLVWVLLFSSSIVSAGQYWAHQQHGGLACHEDSKSSDGPNHLEHCQLCLVHWVQFEAPLAVLRSEAILEWATPFYTPTFSATRWYALSNPTTGPPLAV